MRIAKRRELFERFSKEIKEKYPGEPRKARRKMARRLAKKAWVKNGYGA